MTQKELDAACEWITDWIFENAPHSVYDDWMSDKADFYRAMSPLPNEELDKEYNPTYDEAYLQSKIDLVTEARRKDGLTSEQMLAELRGGTCNSDKNLQAIEILSVLRSLYEGNVGDKELKTHEAFSLAIEALKICPKE